MTSRNELADLVESLTPAEFGQVSDIATYLAEKGGPNNPSGQLAEQSIGRLLNKQPPRIKATFKGMREVISTPREMPFQPKRSEAENMAQLGLDVESGSTIVDAMDLADVQQGLMNRMGRDSDRPEEPITTKDILSAAYDAHTGAENE